MALPWCSYLWVFMKQVPSEQIPSWNRPNLMSNETLAPQGLVWHGSQNQRVYDMYVSRNIHINFMMYYSERQGRPPICESSCIIPGTLTRSWNYSFVPPSFSSLIDTHLSIFHRVDCKVNNICPCWVTFNLVASKILLTISYIKIHVI